MISFLPQKHAKTAGSLCKASWEDGGGIPASAEKSRAEQVLFSLRFTSLSIKLGQGGTLHRIWVNKLPINKHKHCP